MESAVIELLSDKDNIEEFFIINYETEPELKEKERIYNLRLI